MWLRYRTSFGSLGLLVALVACSQHDSPISASDGGAAQATPGRPAPRPCPGLLALVAPARSARPARPALSGRAAFAASAGAGGHQHRHRRSLQRWVGWNRRRARRRLGGGPLPAAQARAAPALAVLQARPATRRHSLKSRPFSVRTADSRAVTPTSSRRGSRTTRCFTRRSPAGTVLAECDYMKLIEPGDPSKSALVRLMNRSAAASPCRPPATRRRAFPPQISRPSVIGFRPARRLRAGLSLTNTQTRYFNTRRHRALSAK